MYIEWEIGQKQYANVQALFTRCIRSVLNIELWKLYLNYIKKVNSPSAGVSPADSKVVLVQTFEFVLSHVGLDLQSTSIWKDYLEFIKSWEVYTNAFAHSLHPPYIRLLNLKC
jgi:cleavage stimulation factor subunit 3